MRNRSWRRAQRERAIARAKRRSSIVGWSGHKADSTEWIRKSATTPCPCSNFCCGNPRKWFGEITRQEQVSLINQREQTAASAIVDQTHQNRHE
jgi:hypothetical protein